MVELHQDDAEKHEDGGGDGEEHVGQIDELGTPGPQTHLTRETHLDALPSLPAQLFDQNLPSCPAVVAVAVRCLLLRVHWVRQPV